MSTIQALWNKAEKAAQAARNAEAAAEKASAERHARNVERRTAFWSDAGDRCTHAQRAAADARRAVVDLVSTGDMTGALEAYTAYVRAVGAAQVVVTLAQNATATYVYQVRRVVDGEYRETDEVRVLRSEWTESTTPSHCQTEYAKGVPDGHIQDPVPFVTLLEAGIGDLLAAHVAEFRTELLAPLRAELEPED